MASCVEQAAEETLLQMNTLSFTTACTAVDKALASFERCCKQAGAKVDEIASATLAATQTLALAKATSVEVVSIGSLV
jgi:ABC-type tungstate transport system permease subunit